MKKINQWMKTQSVKMEMIKRQTDKAVQAQIEADAEMARQWYADFEYESEPDRSHVAVEESWTDEELMYNQELTGDFEVYWDGK